VSLKHMNHMIVTTIVLEGVRQEVTT
jgi:hypothetical protein